MGKEKKNILIIVFLAITIFLSGFLYRDSFSAYFFQDDWFSLRISQAKNISEVLNFFVPRTDVIYYRPLGMQVPYYILSSVFGVNPLPFHLLTFFTHALNIFLVFLLIRLLSKNIFVALLSSFLYGTSVIHFTPFFWFSTYSFVLGPTAFFLAFILFLRRQYYLSLMIYVIGLMINEQVAVLPVVLLLYSLCRKRRTLGLFIPYVIVGLLIFLSRFAFFPPPTVGSYQMNVGRHVLNNLEAYLLWSFNLPEEIKAQLINFVTVNPLFIRDFGFYFWVFLITLLVNLSIFYIIPILVLIHKKKKVDTFVLILGSLWFIIGLLPVLSFPKHVFSYYLPISLVGLLLVSLHLLSKLIEVVSRINRWFTISIILLIVFNWLFASLATIEFNSKVHWVKRRSNISKNLIEKAKESYQKELTIYVRPDPENKLSLNDQDAFKIIFNDSRIKTVYGYAKDKKSL